MENQSHIAHAKPPSDLSLPAIDLTGGMPSMDALKQRRSSRAFSTQALPDDVLSNLLWAANGINRPETGGRTAASACNWQEIDIYVIRPEGAYGYDPQEHRLIGRVAGDLRADAGARGLRESGGEGGQGHLLREAFLPHRRAVPASHEDRREGGGETLHCPCGALLP